MKVAGVHDQHSPSKIIMLGLSLLTVLQALPVVRYNDDARTRL